MSFNGDCRPACASEHHAQHYGMSALCCTSADTKVVLAIVQHNQASVRLATSYATLSTSTYKLLPFTAAETQSTPR